MRLTETISPTAYFSSVVNAANVLSEHDQATATALCGEWKQGEKTWICGDGTEIAAPGARGDNEVDEGMEEDEDVEPNQPDPVDPPDPALRDPTFDAGFPLKLKEAYLQAKHSTYDKTPYPVFPPTFTDAIAGFDDLANPSSDAQGKAQSLQHALTAVLEEITSEAHIITQTPADRACTKSNKASGPISVQTTISPDKNHQLPPAAQITTNQLRTNTLTLPPRQCPCGKSQLSPSHCLSCKKLRGRFIRHDVIVCLLAKMFVEVGVVSRTEVRVVGGTSKRMDVVAYLPCGVFWADVSVVNPAARTSSTSKTPPVEVRAKAKQSRWGKHAEAADVSFVPATLDSLRQQGEGFKTALRYISHLALTAHPYPLTCTPEAWKTKYYLGLRHRVAVTVAHANHLILEEAKIKSHLTGAARPNVRAIYKQLCQQHPRSRPVDV